MGEFKLGRNFLVFDNGDFNQNFLQKLLADGICIRKGLGKVLELKDKKPKKATIYIIPDFDKIGLSDLNDVLSIAEYKYDNISILGICQGRLYNYLDIENFEKLDLGKV